MNLKKEIAGMLRKARHDAGLNLYQASAALGVSRKTLQRYESVRTTQYPTVGLLWEMAVLYECRVSELVPDPTQTHDWDKSVPHQVA